MSQAAEVKHKAKHPSKCIAIKTAQVDLKMLPVVRWINSFNWASTRWCCQGNAAEKPLVIFHTESSITLARILDKLRGFAVTEAEYCQDAGSIRYIARFEGPGGLEQFVSHLEQFKD